MLYQCNIVTIATVTRSPVCAGVMCSIFTIVTYLIVFLTKLVFCTIQDDWSFPSSSLLYRLLVFHEVKS